MDPKSFNCNLCLIDKVTPLQVVVSHEGQQIIFIFILDENTIVRWLTMIFLQRLGIFKGVPLVDHFLTTQGIFQWTGSIGSKSNSEVISCKAAMGLGVVYDCIVKDFKFSLLIDSGKE
jgi:hypothetical protein